MNWRSENRGQRTEDRRRKAGDILPFSALHCLSPGFTLIEAMAAIALLTFISVSVWIALERCMVLAADTAQRNRAFEIARENMENIVGLDTVEENTEFGVSEMFPDIRWQTTIESFYEMHAGRMWVQAISSAEYTDAEGQTQSVSLTYWLTDLSDDQMRMLMENKQQQADLLANHIIETEELAAEYAGVNVETIREWVRNDMPTFEGMYIKPWLKLYGANDGEPTDGQKLELIKRYPELAKSKREESQMMESPPPPPGSEETSPDSTPPAETDSGQQPLGPPPMPSN
ncbi:MAG: prepilin-type N-terminal cleavage/methylation domain-containing protein [Sedimentisphaerales bacterium]|nr:prepilin-type N-terminal cleavage/methylation domain-containing protein [Sedimentisphaerales bacterium]